MVQLNISHPHKLYFTCTSKIRHLFFNEHQICINTEYITESKQDEQISINSHSKQTICVVMVKMGQSAKLAGWTVLNTAQESPTLLNSYHQSSTLLNSYHQSSTLPNSYHQSSTLPNSYHQSSTLLNSYHQSSALPKLSSVLNTA